MKLIVGLGNPERVYGGTRHNIGFMCVNAFAKAHKIPFDKKQGEARTGAGPADSAEVVVARPQTHMNASGESVGRLVKRYRVDLTDLVVIHDDLDLPLGKVRIRMGGSAGGHKGISSIINRLGSGDFVRIRVGIGRPPGERPETKDEDVIKYVLSPFTREERAIMSQSIERVSKAILCIVTEGLQAAMDRYN